MQLNMFRRYKSIFIIMFIISVILLFFAWDSLEVLSNNAENGVEASKIYATESKTNICYIKENYVRLPEKNMTVIYFVTPTYPRPEQIPELIRLSHTLMLVPQLVWIVADLNMGCSEEVTDVLRRSNLPFVHIQTTPSVSIRKNTVYPRGVDNRLAALSWIQKNVTEGVLYFGDDDNTYDLRLFSEIRTTEKVSMFPVGMIGKFGVSSPIVRNGQVVGFYDSWPHGRIYPVDMAGFAVNIKFLKPAATMPHVAGLEEDGFLTSNNVRLGDIQPLAENCSRILVWHTQTVKYKKPTVRINIKKLDSIGSFNSFTELLKETERLGMVSLSSDSGVKPYISKNGKTFYTMASVTNHVNVNF